MVRDVCAIVGVWADIEVYEVWTCLFFIRPFGHWGPRPLGPWPGGGGWGSK